MKKRVLGLTILILTSLCSCDSFIIKKNHELKIFVATDTHLFSKNLISEDNEKYKKSSITSDGRVQEYDYELVEELINITNKENPDYLFLTGDLSFNGEKDSHLELVKLLNKVNNTKVLVIPGNHDYNNLNSMSIIDDTAANVSSITMDEFKQIYKDYGYSGAISYDSDSLSYIYKLSDTKWALMLDTTLSEFNYEVDFNVVGGGLSDISLSWIEDNLKIAKENNIEVISSSHHNLITHNELFESSYTLSNADELLDLYAKYNVKLNFSGHLHIQNIKSKEIEGNKIYDVSMVSLLDYGNRYGVLDIYENCYDFKTYNVNPSLGFDFNEYSFNVFYQKYYNKQVKPNSIYYKNKNIDTDALTDFTSKINAYYFDGNYKAIAKLVKENEEFKNVIKEINKDKYISLIMDVNKKEKHNELLIKK